MGPVTPEDVRIYYDNGWRVDKPTVTRQPGEPITWFIDKNGAPDEDAKAYLQFPPGLLVTEKEEKLVEFELVHKTDEPLMTKVIPNHALKSKIPYSYAIFIDEPNAPPTKLKAFIRGHNPPPEIIVGP